MEIVERDLIDLQYQRLHVERLHEMAETNKKIIQSQNPFPFDVRRWYAAHVAMCIRRELDGRDDVISFRNILTDMKAHPDAVLIASHVPELLRPATLPGVIDIDLANLQNVARRVKRYANKIIAHRARKGYGDERLPTFNEVSACIGEVEEIARKYIALLTGHSYSGLTPTETFDWTALFSFAWYVAKGDSPKKD